jgi:mannose-1-phosphate guanylyltransferase
VIRKAFLPGAGLGTRLRPLTDLLPKPLVPLFHRPLIEWSMRACAVAGITDFAINTHHLPGCWETGYGRLDVDNWFTGDLKGGNGLPVREGRWEGRPVHLFHEPEVLETGGGIKNAETWSGGESVLVYNGDIYSTLPLERLMAAHEASGNPVTLALRSTGPLHIAFDGEKAVDIRNRLGRGEGTHAFSGIYCYTPALLDLIPGGEKISVIPAFLELAARGQLGAVLLDEGVWYDLGDAESYLRAHRELDLDLAIHTLAKVDPSATVRHSVVSAHARIGPGSMVEDSVIWPGAVVKGGEAVASRILLPG